MKPTLGALLSCFLLLLSMVTEASRLESIAAQSGGETLQYTVKYQGLLSAFLPVEIAKATLQLHPGSETVDDEQMRRASLSVTTEPFPRMESLYSIRFNYDSWFDPGLRYTAVVDMRKQTSSNRHELLWFDRREEVIRRYREEQQADAAVPVLPGFLRQVSRLQPTARFRERGVFPLTGSDVLDRLAMLYALRHRPLQTDEISELAVSNGKDLQGYSIFVEAREKLIVDGQPVSTLRLRFTPRFAAGGDRGYAVRVWLSDDEQRLPIRFHSSSLGGSIELNLNQLTNAAE